MLQEFTQEIENTARAAVDDIHTALPGKIIAFDESSGTVTVQPVGKYVTFDEIELDYPIISEVPLVFPICQQEGVGIAFPVKKGDSCIIIISEVELDEWRSGAKSEGPLRFDLTSAVAIPGLLKGNNQLVSRATKMNAVIVKSSGTELVVSESGIAIGGDLKVKGNIYYTGTCQRD